MPLDRHIEFKTKLQRYNRIVVPRHFRWQYKMEKGELLRVNVIPVNSESIDSEEFLAKMGTDGRLTIPKLSIEILAQAENKDLTGSIFEVQISPMERSTETPLSHDTANPDSATEKILGQIKDMRKTFNNSTSQ